MIEQNCGYKFPARLNGKELRFLYNYTTDNPGELIKWECDSDEGYITGYIQRKHLFEFLWMIGKPEEQRKMIPQTVRKTRYIEKFVGITTTRDIRKGEKLNFKIALDVPLSEEELISEVKRSNSKIIKPL